MTGGTENRGQHESTAHLWAQAAHDLRQPVQAVLLLTKTPDRRSGRTELKRTLRQIGTASESLHGMLEVLTLLSRIEAGLQIVQLRPCQLADVLEPAIREIAKIATERGITLRFRRMRGLVRSNPKLLVTAIRSLLLNAIKFSDGGEILACCRRRRGQLRLEVHFKGSSLDVRQARNAFIQLAPGKDFLATGELGLGLAFLEHLCRPLGHCLQYTHLPPDGQLLALSFPLLATHS